MAANLESQTMNLKKLFWAGVYLALLLLPIATSVLAARAAGLEPRHWLDDWAAGLGMIGFSIVLISFFLLGRFKPLSGWLGSDWLMQAHQLFARTAVVLLVLHPFFYTLWRTPMGLPDAWGAQALRIGAGSWGLFTGLVALGCLLALVFVALYRHRSGIPYERWRLMHSALALAVLGFGLHHTLVSGQYAQLQPVAALWWSLAALALASWLWVYLVRPLWQGVRPYRVHKLERCAERIWLLEIAPQNPHPAAFRAGQFAWLKLRQRWPHRDNPFSMSNGPNPQGVMQFLIKEAGDMTRGLSHCTKGDLAYVDGPHGRFEIPAQASAVVMHAGGIGVAPFVSLLADCVARKEARPIRLIYADKRKEQMVDVLALSGASALPDFHLLAMVEEAGAGWDGLTGRLDAAGLKLALEHPALAPMAETACHLVCGPEPMMDAVETALVARGVAAEHVLSEHFKYDFAGQSPLARRMRQGWWLVSAASLMGLALALAWR